MDKDGVCNIKLANDIYKAIVKVTTKAGGPKPEYTGMIDGLIIGVAEDDETFSISIVGHMTINRIAAMCRKIFEDAHNRQPEEMVIPVE